MTRPESAIAKAGLIASLVDTPSVQPEGTFLGQSPTAGAEVSQGSTVTVRYSSGIPVAPDLIGLSEGEVGDAIAAYNAESRLSLSYVIRRQDVLNQANVGIVVRTAPGPSAPVADGSVITVFIGELVENGGGGDGSGGGGNGGDGGDGGD